MTDEIKSVSVKEMREIENKAFASGTSVLELMERAGKGCAEIITLQVGTNKKIIIFCGPGNNGGDGLVCARYLSENQEVAVVLPIEPKTDVAKENLERAKKTNVKFLNFEESEEFSKSADVVVDALLGIGAKKGLRSPIKEACNRINQSEGFKISIDVPTGMDADSGETDEHAVLPDATLCIHAAKKGIEKEWEKSGRLWIVAIGL